MRSRQSIYSIEIQQYIMKARCLCDIPITQRGVLQDTPDDAIVVLKCLGSSITIRTQSLSSNLMAVTKARQFFYHYDGKGNIVI